MRIQCGRMQRTVLHIIMRIVGLVWTGLQNIVSYKDIVTKNRCVQVGVASGPGNFSWDFGNNALRMDSLPTRVYYWSQNIRVIRGE